MEKDLAFYIALSQSPGIGPGRFKVLLENFKTAGEVWNTSDKLLTEILTTKVFAEFNQFRQKTDPQKNLESIYSKNISLVTLLDKDYPALLKEIHFPPPVLYVRGEIKKADSLALAVVGSRKVTSYGRQVTEILVSELVGAGLTIVSGLARGVDALSHETALKNGGRTIAVLGSGVDVIYPPENTNLAKEILKNGAIISEFPPGMQPTPGNFPARNRIISGLSLGVLVTEADEKSGSLITASYALEQNRDVFAVPGPIYSQLSKGPSLLIKQGAKLASSASDVLEELNLDQQIQVSQNREIIADSSEEQIILDLLANEQKHVDSLIRESGLTSDKLAGFLITMELKGKVKNLGGGNYCLVR